MSRHPCSIRWAVMIGSFGVHKLPLARYLLALLAGSTLFLSSLPAAGPALGASLSPWSAPVNLSLSSGRSAWPTIQEDPVSGDLFVVWTDFSMDPYGEILVRRRVAASRDWTSDSNLSQWPGMDGSPGIFADPGGRVHLAWTRRDTATGTDLLYRVWDGASWSDTQVLDHTDVFQPFYYGLFFLLDGAGRVCLFVTSGAGTAKTCLEQGSWEPLPPFVYVPGIGGLGAIVLGPDGLFHAAVFGLNEGGQSGCDPWLDDVYYATTDGTSWTLQQNLSSVGSIAYDTALAFDGQGRLHVLWSDISPFCSYDSERSAVYERILAGGTWGPRLELTVPNKDQAVEDLALAVDGAGQMHLAWSEGMFDGQGVALDLTIHYRCRCGDDWGKEEEVLAPSKYSINVDLVVGKSGTARVVWEEGEPKEVFFSERGSLHWSVFLPLLPRGDH